MRNSSSSSNNDNNDSRNNRTKNRTVLRVMKGRGMLLCNDTYNMYGLVGWLLVLYYTRDCAGKAWEDIA